MVQPLPPSASASGRPAATPGAGDEALLRISHLKKRYGAWLAVDDVSFSVAAGEFFTMLGPSGCGKTSTLRCIAGLEMPFEGEIVIDRKLVYSAAQRIQVPANHRDIAMVFQSYAIWPHMSVFGNVAFPLEARGVRGAELKSRVGAALETVGLAAMADRPAPMLSGGQQQRVALARAIVANAKLLLLDEPLSNLDAALRIQMRAELRNIQRRLGATMIYVTHDQEEAMSLSDRIAVMRNGKIVEIGAPQDLYHRPRSVFTAQFVGQSEVLPCDLPAAPAGGRVEARAPFGVVMCTGVPQGIGPGRHGLLVRPEHIQILPRGSVPEGLPNRFPARIESRSFSGRLIDYHAAVGASSLAVQTLSTSEWEVGAPVVLHMPPAHCIVVEGSPG
ncbi:ABC transporter ATP-binding protein [Xanthobacter tagetidis]